MGIKNMPENLQDSEKSTTFALANEKYRGVEQLVARQAHNLEVACSSPASATTTSEKQITKAFRTFFVYTPVQGSNSKAQIYRVSHNIATVLLSVIPKHPETKRRYPCCLCRAVESAVGHTDSADVDGLMTAVAGKPMMGSLEQV